MKNHKLSVHGISTQALAAKAIVNSNLWQTAKAKRNKAMDRGNESLKAKMDGLARIISDAARGFEKDNEIFENAVAVLIDEVTTVDFNLEEELKPAKK
jgi:capsid protein